MRRMSSCAGIAASTGMPTFSAKAAASPVPSSLLITMPATPTLPPSLRKYSTALHTLLATYSDCKSLLPTTITFWHMSRAIGRPKPPQTTSPRKSSRT